MLNTRKFDSSAGKVYDAAIRNNAEPDSSLLTSIAGASSDMSSKVSGFEWAKRVWVLNDMCNDPWLKSLRWSKDWKDAGDKTSVLVK